MRIESLSVIIPVYRNESTLAELTKRLLAALDGLANVLEIIFVDDASPDSSSEVLARLVAENGMIRVITNAQNIGQQRSVLEGFRASRGEFMTVMDADLQDPPEAIPQLIERLVLEDADVVFAGRRGMYESRFRLFSSRIFKALLHRIAGAPRDAGLYFVANRRTIERVLGFSDSSPWVVALVASTRPRMVSIPVERSMRIGSPSSYSTFKRLQAGFAAVACAMRHRNEKPQVPISPYTSVDNISTQGEAVG